MAMPTLAIALAGLVGAVPAADRSKEQPTEIPVETLYHGKVPYVWSRSFGCYFRNDDRVQRSAASNRLFGQHSLAPFQDTENVKALRRAMGVSLPAGAKPEEVWEAARSILRWMHTHGKHVAQKEDDLLKEGKGWPSVERIADAYAKNRQLTWGACFSHAHLAFQLLRVAGLPTNVIGIASARYNLQDKTPEHVYLGLRVGGEWYYIDPGAGPLPAYAERKSMGRNNVGQKPGCDYAHPHSFITASDAKLKAIPLLGPAPQPPPKK